MALITARRALIKPKKFWVVKTDAQAVANNGTASISFTVNLGAPDPDRLIVASIPARIVGGTLGTIQLGSTSMSVIAQTAVGTMAIIAALAQPNGTSATFTINAATGTMTDAVVDIYAVYTKNQAAFSTNNASVSGGPTSITNNIVIPEKGFSVSALCLRGTSEQPSWTNATQDNLNQGDLNGQGFMARSFKAGSLAITASVVQANPLLFMASASWGP